MDNNLYFYRDSHGNEIDILQEDGYKLNLFEIKSAQTFTPHFLKGIDYFRKIAPDRISTSSIIYAGEGRKVIKDCKIYNYREI